ncbi:hypothetical protein [Endozoicomonas acroporae]|uniref:hypothetical protein n=2 Tax=Endozoicomonas acroporae TaxID=1701104 RepID=UPI0013D78205|nr:hypothetical protein [Endozoicomonas acroporae]
MNRITADANKYTHFSSEKNTMPGVDKRHSIWDVKQDQEQSSWLKPLTGIINNAYSFIGQRSITAKQENEISADGTGYKSTQKQSHEEVYHNALTQEQWDDKYREVKLPGNSNQLMQFVIFNDKTNSKDIGVSKNPIGDCQIKQLENILSEVKRYYPVNTPIIHLVYEVFQPELLDDMQKEEVNNFFKKLEAANDNLKVINFNEIKDAVEYGDTASKLRGGIIKQEETGLRKKLWLHTEFIRLMEHHFRDLDEINLTQTWQCMVKISPWLEIINGQKILDCYDLNDLLRFNMLLRCNMVEEFTRQIDMLTLEQIQNIDVPQDPQPLTAEAKALYIDLQRCVLLYDSDIIQDASSNNGSLIYRDFDTIMSAAMPDLSLKTSEILGVEDYVMYDLSNRMEPFCTIENAVMGVACSKNKTIKTVIERTKSQVIESSDPGSLKKNEKYFNSYNYVYQQLINKLVCPTESTFTHLQNGSIRDG